MAIEFPEQTEPLFTETVGVVFTETVATAGADDTQPAVLVPVTEYEVVDAGVTVKLFPLMV